MLKEIKEDLKQYTFHQKMDTNDVSDFFPIKSEESLKSFLDRKHQDWNARKHGFYHLLFTTITKKKKKFAKALLHTVFDRQFIATHWWPQAG